jgi:hypothetical protein
MQHVLDLAGADRKPAERRFPHVTATHGGRDWRVTAVSLPDWRRGRGRYRIDRRHRVLHELAEAGLAILPFEPAGDATIIEIYRRLLAGKVV